MIKEIIDKLVALLAVSALLASCSESELWQNPQTEARDGYIMLNFKTEIPAMHCRPFSFPGVPAWASGL